MGRPATGYRLPDGTKVPGTTTITGRWKESGGLLHWAHKRGVEHPDEPLYAARDEAGSVGTFVHESWEAHLRGTEAPEFPRSFTEKMRDQVKRSLAAAIQWKEDSNLIVTPHERPLVSVRYQFGGTPDATIKGRRGGALGDWKTNKGGFYIDAWFQMAAYILLIEECEPETDLSDGIHLIRFGKNGGEFDHKHIPRDHPVLPLATDQFVRYIDAFNAEKQIKDLV